MRFSTPYVIAAALLFAATASAADYESITGQQLYARYCASCHGMQGRGDGPVASSLTIEVPDLTLLARRAGGTFPRDRVIRIIDGRYMIGAHGSRIMPIWGEEFSNVQVGDPSAQRATLMMIDRLADFLLRLQRPAQN